MQRRTGNAMPEAMTQAGSIAAGMADLTAAGTTDAAKLTKPGLEASMHHL